MQKFTFEDFLKPSMKKALMFVGIFFLMYMIETFFGTIFQAIYCANPCPMMLKQNFADVFTGYSILLTGALKISFFFRLAALLLYYYALACVIDYAFGILVRKGK